LVEQRIEKNPPALKLRSLAPTIPKKFRKKYSGIGTPAAFVLNAMS